MRLFGCQLEYKDMQIDHIDSIYVHCEYKKEKTLDEINEIDNLMPTCRQCNFYKSTFDIETFRNRLTNVMLKNLQKNFSYRLALKYGLIEENIKKSGGNSRLLVAEMKAGTKNIK